MSHGDNLIEGVAHTKVAHLFENDIPNGATAFISICGQRFYRVPQANTRNLPLCVTCINIENSRVG